MTQILNTFNFDNLLIKDYSNWYLLLRNDQVTLGSMVLIEKSFHKKLSDISDESFKEFGEIVKEVELSLKNLFQYEKINYLILMMKDPEVHYHIIPRYSQKKNFNYIDFNDDGWPGVPNLVYINSIDEASKLKLKKLIKDEFTRSISN